MSKINDLLIRIEQIVNNEVTKDEVSMIKYDTKVIRNIFSIRFIG